MSLAEDVDLEEYVTAKDDLSGADIKAVCTEAGLLALRERRMRVTKADFTEAREKLWFCGTMDRVIETLIIRKHISVNCQKVRVVTKEPIPGTQLVVSTHSHDKE